MFDQEFISVEVHRIDLSCKVFYNDHLHRLAADSKIWSLKSNCVNLKTDSMYKSSNKKQLEIVNKYCATCPVRKECLTMALTNFDVDGVWGSTEDQRKDLIVKIRTQTTPFNWSQDSIQFVKQIVDGYLDDIIKEVLV